MAKTAILTKDGLTRYDSNIKDYIKDLTDDTIYIDPDETSSEIENVDSVTSAKYVSYSNADSGLEATNVQEAIDGINKKTDDINTYLQRNSSSKNLLKPTIASDTYGGVTITVNSDKSITLNGITTGGGLVTIGQVQLEADTEYIYSVNPSKNMPDGWFSQVTHRDGQSFVNVSTYGEDITFTNAGAVLKSFIHFHLGVSGTVYDNITLYPMIRLSSIEDDTYQPYYEDTMSSINYLNDKVNYLSNELSTVSTSVDSLKYNALERTDVVDNLSSTATRLPLSANMGRDINERLNAHSERFEVLYERFSFSVVKMGKIVRLVGAIELTNTAQTWDWIFDFRDIADKYKPLASRTIKDVSQLYTFELNRWGYVQTTESLPAGNYYFDVAWLIS